MTRYIAIVTIQVLILYQLLKNQNHNHQTEKSEACQELVSLSVVSLFLSVQGAVFVTVESPLASSFFASVLLSSVFVFIFFFPCSSAGQSSIRCASD